MHYRKLHVLFYSILLCVFSGCNDKKKTTQKVIIAEPVRSTDAIDVYIKNTIAKSQERDGKLDDSTSLPFLKTLVYFYDSAEFAPVWSTNEKWNGIADSLLAYLDTADRDGLFREDYQLSRLQESKKMLADSVKMRDKQLWAQADVLYSNSFLHILQDLCQGRLQPDSLAFKNDTSKYRGFFSKHLNSIIAGEQFTKVIRSVQPVHKGYERLKLGIRKFTDSMDKRSFTYLVYPYKKGKPDDSLAFIKKLKIRLNESGVLNQAGALPDSASLASALKKYQASKKLKVDGKVGPELIKTLNATDVEKFKRIAITLDRFKQLPATLPSKYIWVNIPAYKLEVWDGDTVVLESKVICGKPGTPTPALSSAISDLVIYPTWTVPESIITKELLPGLKKNTGYLARKGLNLINNKGEKVDPATVSWAKYSRGIPYKIQQGSGDNNALGVIKFNFNNPYAVYLHDTNQRYLFKNAKRALSHGCVRVQEWEKLANYIMRNDSIRYNRPDSIKNNVDSIKKWIGNKERHRIIVKYQFPLFIRYFGCEAVNGNIRFYDDIYGSDKIMSERFFSQKKI